MEPNNNDVGATRSRTDERLAAERATTDDSSDRAAVRAQLVVDDLIERDRLSADERLLKYREASDDMVAIGRSAVPARDRAVATERDAADDDKKAERDITDSILEGQRRRADVAMEAERRERRRDKSRLRAYRRDTDDQLSTERSEADEISVTLAGARTALTRAGNEQSRRSEIFGMVTHDLRNPLSVIAVNARWITEETTASSIREAGEQVMLAAARMERLLADLLDIARIESGTLSIVRRTHDVGALVNEVFATYRPLFHERRMSLTVEAPREPTVASFDHDRIVQVLSNLLGNAMKFVGASGRVALRVVRGEGEIEFTLSDSGPGIHPDQVAHVFERFWQVDSNVRRGLGLGLYICEQVVVTHGGRIWVESDVGKGATFHFTLPIG